VGKSALINRLCAQEGGGQRPPGRGDPRTLPLGRVGQGHRSCSTPPGVLPPRLDESALPPVLLALCDDIARAALMTARPFGAPFLRLSTALTGQPGSWPQPWAGGEPLNGVSPSVGSIPAMAARWWMGWPGCTARRTATPARYGPMAQRLLERLRRSCRRHRPGTARHAPATAAMTGSGSAETFAMGGRLVSLVVPKRCRCGSTLAGGPAAGSRAAPAFQKFNRSPAWCGHGIEGTGQDALGARDAVQLWNAPPEPLPLLLPERCPLDVPTKTPPDVLTSRPA